MKRRKAFCDSEVKMRNGLVTPVENISKHFTSGLLDSNKKRDKGDDRERNGNRDVDRAARRRGGEEGESCKVVKECDRRLGAEHLNSRKDKDDNSTSDNLYNSQIHSTAFHSHDHNNVGSQISQDIELESTSSLHRVFKNRARVVASRHPYPRKQKETEEEEKSEVKKDNDDYDGDTEITGRKLRKERETITNTGKSSMQSKLSTSRSIRSRSVKRSSLIHKKENEIGERLNDIKSRLSSVYKVKQNRSKKCKEEYHDGESSTSFTSLKLDQFRQLTPFSRRSSINTSSLHRMQKEEVSLMRGNESLRVNDSRERRYVQSLETENEEEQEREQEQEQEQYQKQDQEQTEKDEEKEEEAEEEDTNIDSHASRLMAVFCKGKYLLGIACYNEIDRVLSIDEFNLGPGDMDIIISGVKQMFQPNVLIISSKLLANPQVFELFTSSSTVKSSENLPCKLDISSPAEAEKENLKNIDQYNNNNNYDSSSSRSSSSSRVRTYIDNSMDIKFLQNSKWDYDYAIKIICQFLKIHGVNDYPSTTNNIYVNDSFSHGDQMEMNYNYNDQYNMLNPILNFQRIALISSLGALLFYLQANIFSLESNGNIMVSKVKHLDIHRFMHMEPLAYRALNIFNEEHHPNVMQTKRGKSKEGFSLFALFLNNISSKCGKSTLKEWFNKPLTDIDEIRRRQILVGFFLLPENRELICYLQSLLKQIANVPAILMRIKRVFATFRDWSKLICSLDSIAQCYDLLLHIINNVNSNTHREFYSLIRAWLDKLDKAALAEVIEDINDAIDFDASNLYKEIQVNEGYDQELDEMCSIYYELEELLIVTANDELFCSPLIEELSVQFFPQIGYLVAVEKQFADVITEEEYTLIFEEAGVLYFKTPRTTKLDTEIGDLQSDIRDRTKSLIRLLEDSILLHEASLNTFTVIFAEIDVLIAFSQVAVTFEFTKPEVSEENVIIIKEGRHPLQELVVETFISNDTFLVPSSNMMAITGPNYSGKSVYLKQVGIIVFLAHIGSFIPAKHGKIGLVDRIFTRILSSETCTLHQSTFTIDLNQMASMLKYATPKSLLLVDEFGKGTAPNDGIALLASSMEELVERGSKTIVALHFQEVFQYNLLRPSLQKLIVCYKMEYYAPHTNNHKIDNENRRQVVNSNKDINQNQQKEYQIIPITPLFKLTRGLASSSNGLSCARLAGVDMKVLKRALHVSRCLSNGTLITIPKKPLCHDILIQPLLASMPSMQAFKSPLLPETEKSYLNSSTVNYNMIALLLLSLFFSKSANEWAIATDEDILKISNFIWAL